MCAHDIASTLQELHMIDVNTAGEVIICLNLKVIAEHMAKLKASTSRQYVIDEEYLRWTPLVSKHPSSSPEKSSPEKPSTLVRSFYACHYCYYLFCNVDCFICSF